MCFEALEVYCMHAKICVEIRYIDVEIGALDWMTIHHLDIYFLVVP
jgi:hypothetical protein